MVSAFHTVPRCSVLLLLVLLIACRDSRHTVTGSVVAIDESEDHITISHGEIPGLMPAMTMRFALGSPELLVGIAPGMRVQFELEEEEDEQLIVRRLTRIGSAADSGRPGVHDHTPHHGGVVTMVGLRHLEAVADPSGLVRVYLTDAWRRPLLLAGWTGTVTLHTSDGRQTLTLAPRDGALEADGPALEGTEVLAHLRVAQVGKRPLEMHSALPLRPGVAGAPVIPTEGCVAPRGPAAANTLRPHCTLAFPEAITAVAASPDGEMLLVAVVNGGVTAWRLPTIEFLHGFMSAPPVAASADSAPHPDAASTIVFSPDGRQAIVATEAQLLRHAVATGRLLRLLSGPGGAVHNVAWSPGGTHLLVTTFYGSAAHVLLAEDGRAVRQLPVGREASVVTFSEDGRLAAVGSDAGQILLYDLEAESVPPRPILEVGRPLHAMAIVRGRLVSAGAGGVVHIVDLATGTITARSAAASPCYRLATSPDGSLVACAAYDRRIRLYDTDAAELRATLEWHGASVLALAWPAPSDGAGGRPYVVSGDADGHLAFWEITAALQQ